MPRSCENRIRLWPLRRDDHTGALIGASGTRRSDWLKRTRRLLAFDITRAGTNASSHLAATMYKDAFDSEMYSNGIKPRLCRFFKSAFPPP